MLFSLESSIFFSTLPSGVMKKVAQAFDQPIHAVCVVSLPRRTGYCTLYFAMQAFESASVSKRSTDHLQTHSCIVGRELGNGRSGPITRTRIEEVDYQRLAGEGLEVGGFPLHVG